MNRTLTTIIAITVTAAGLLTAAPTATATPSATTSVTTSVTAAAPTNKIDKNFVRRVLHLAPTLADQDPNLIVESGKGICEAFKQGATPADMRKAAKKAGLLKKEVNALMMAATEYYCRGYWAYGH